MAKTILHCAGKYYEIPKGQKIFTIGRGKDRDLQVVVSSVSRIHSTLLLKENGRYDLRDDGSKYGTSVRGKNISKDIRVELKNGDKIIIGKNETVITVKIEDEEELKVANEKPIDDEFVITDEEVDEANPTDENIANIEAEIKQAGEGDENVSNE